MEEIIDFTIDVGIIVNPIKHPDLVIVPLAKDEVTGWQIEAEKKSKKTDEKTIICDPDLHQTQWILKHMQKKGISYQRMITTNNLEVIGRLAASGIGIGILPENVVKTLYKNQTLKLSRVKEMPVYQDEICLVYRHENRGIKATQVMIEAIKNGAKR
jgi:DNA-binding transcriptional LysR family regulator